MEDKREKGKGKERSKKCTTHKNQRKERGSPSHEGKLSHPQPLVWLACKSRDLIMVKGLK